MKALYSRRSDRDLATISWGGLAGVRGQFDPFSSILEQISANEFGTVTGSVRIRRDAEPDPVECALDQFRNLRHGQSDRLIDAKLGLEPTVLVSKIELVELYLEDRISLGDVPLRAVGDGWSIVGRPRGTEPESLLFVDVLFDMPSPDTSLSFSFRTKTDIWLSYGLDGEPTEHDHRSNRAKLCSRGSGSAHGRRARARGARYRRARALTRTTWGPARKLAGIGHTRTKRRGNVSFREGYRDRGATLNAFYTFRENRELAVLAWDGLKTRDAMRDAFERFVAALHTGMFGKIGGSVRVATGSAYDPSIETCSVSELALYSRDDQWLVDAKLELQPPVKASDGRIELIELAEDESPLGEVTLRPFGEHWSVIGTPAKVRDESLLFVEVDFDPPGNGGSMIAWFRSKTDLWLAYGLDGEPTGPDHQANRQLLIDALRDVAARTDATLELRELDRAP